MRSCLIAVWVYISVLLSLVKILGNRLEYGMKGDIRVFIDPFIFLILLTSHVIVLLPTTVILYCYIGYTALRMKSRLGPEDQESSSKVQMKVTKMLGMVLGIYLFTYILVIGVNPLLESDATDSGMNGETWKEHVRRVSLLIYYSNTWLNPLIYAWKAADFRKAFRTILHMEK